MLKILIFKHFDFILVSYTVSILFYQVYVAKVVSGTIIYLHFKTVINISFVNCEILLANFKGNTNLHILSINHSDTIHKIVNHIFKHRRMIFFLYSILIYFLPLGYD